MKITILGAGVGASHYINDKKQNMWPPAFLVEWKGGQLLLECSQAVQQRLEQAGVDYTSIHNIAISHPHPDHCAPIHFIQSVYIKGFIDKRFINKNLTIYGPDHLVKNFKTLWRIHTPDHPEYLDFPKLTLVPMSDTSLHPISSKTKKEYLVNGAKLTSRKVYHAWGKCDAVSYRLDTPEGIVVYSGDTGECEGIREIARGADVFICEASARIGDFDFPKGYGHLNPETVGDIAREAGVKKVVLFHYTGLDSDEAMTEEVKKAGFMGEVIAGKDFQVVDV